MKKATRSTRGLVVVVVLAAAAVASAGSLTRLPEDYEIPKAERSPGQVTFRHTTHVKAKTADCTVCHPGDFKILEAKTADGAPITHKRMNKGELCGACHNGEKSFGLDDCEMCHEEED